MKRLPKLRQVKILVITLLALVVPFSAYYVFYSANQKEYFVKRDFRLLSVLGAGIEKKVDAIGEAYARAAKSATRQYYVSGCNSVKPEEAKKALKKELVPVADSQSIEPDKMEAEPRGQQLSEPILEVRQESGVQWLFFKFTDKQKDECPAVAVSAKTRLEDFVAPFFRQFVNGGDFNSVFLADVEGQLLYQWAPDEVHLTNFNALVGKNGAKIDFNQLKQNSNVVDVTIAETDYKLFLQPIELSFGKTSDRSNQKIRWAAGGLVRTSHLMSESRAVSYTILIVITFLFILVVLSLPFLKVIFMGPKDVLGVADIYFLAFGTLVGSALLTAFLMFTVSYVDLEKKMDGQLESLSDHVSENFQDELGRAIRQLDRLNNNRTLKRDLAELNEKEPPKPGDHSAPGPTSTEKRHANHVVAGSDPPPDAAEVKARLDSRVDPRLKEQCPKETRCFGRTNVLKTNLVSTTDDPYPYFTNAFWTDNSGQQRIKWTAKSVLPTFLTINERPYFTNALAGRTWNYKNENNKGENNKNEQSGFYLEPVYSKASGNLQVVLSKPMPGREKEWVSSMDFRALSLVQTVLPGELGYGYSVIDDEGKVLFHSDDSKNLVENLFRESDNDSSLQATVLGRARKATNVQYQGTGYRMYASPLPNTPWTLVTFRDKRLARSAALEFVALAIYFFCIYALALLLVFSLYYVSNREHRSALLWPYKKREGNYHLSVVFNLLLALIFLLGIIYGGRWLVILLTMSLPAIGIVFHHYNVRRSANLGMLGRIAERLLARRTLLNYRHSYVLTLVSLLMLVSVLPMIAFFTFAYDREMRRLVELGQINLARGLENRALRIQSQLEALAPNGLKPGDREFLLHQRLKLNPNQDGSRKNFDVYTRFFFNSETAADGRKSGGNTRSCVDAFLHWQDNAEQREECVGAFFDWAAPFQSSIGLPVLGVSRTAANNDTVGLLRHESDKGKLILHTEGKVDGNELHKGFSVSSDLPTLANGWSMLWRLGLLGILLFVPSALFAVISFVGGRLFLLASDEPIWFYKEELNESALSQNLFLIASRFTKKDDALNRSGFRVIDLRSIKSPKDWSQFYDDKYSNGHDQTGIAINHFEYRLADLDTNVRKIKLVEHFLAHNRTVIVASTVDLASYTLSAASAKESSENGDENGHNDSRIPATFNSLRRFCLEDRGLPKAFNVKLKRYRNSLDLEGRSRREIRRIDRLFKAVKRECQSRAYLQELGERLLTRKDFIYLNPDRISWRVQDRCDAYYHALWNTCTSEEKLTLVRLATHHLVSSHNPSLPGLLRRGLVFREPFLRPMNDSFTRFVAAQATPENVQDWKGANQHSVWEILRFPLLLALIVVAGFLFVSQRELYNSTLTFVTAFAAVMPVLFKFLGMFPGGKGGAVS